MQPGNWTLFGSEVCFYVRSFLVLGWSWEWLHIFWVLIWKWLFFNGFMWPICFPLAFWVCQFWWCYYKKCRWVCFKCVLEGVPSWDYQAICNVSVFISACKVTLINLKYHRQSHPTSYFPSLSIQQIIPIFFSYFTSSKLNENFLHFYYP